MATYLSPAPTNTYVHLEPDILYTMGGTDVFHDNGNPLSFNISGDGFTTWQRFQTGLWDNPATVYDTWSLQYKMSSSPTFGGTYTYTVDLNGVTYTVTLITRAADTSPNQFTFTDQLVITPTNQVASGVNNCQITGVEDDATINFNITGNGSNHQYRIGTGNANAQSWGAWTNCTGTPTIAYGEWLQLRMDSPGTSGQVGNIQVTMGSTTDTFSVTYDSNDYYPDQFTFNDVNAAQSSVKASNIVTITGISTAVNATFSTSGNGSNYQYRKNGGTWTNLATVSVSNNDTIQLRMTVPATLAQTGSIQMTISGVTDTWTVTSAVGDTSPDAFSFLDVTGANYNQVYTSNQVTVTGITVDTPISIVGGSYSIGTGAFVTDPGEISNNSTLRLRLTSTNYPVGTATATVTIGTFQASFNVTTQGSDSTSQYVVTFRELIYGADV